MCFSPFAQTQAATGQRHHLTFRAAFSFTVQTSGEGLAFSLPPPPRQFCCSCAAPATDAASPSFHPQLLLRLWFNTRLTADNPPPGRLQLASDAGSL